MIIVISMNNEILPLVGGDIILDNFFIKKSDRYSCRGVVGINGHFMNKAFSIKLSLKKVITIRVNIINRVSRVLKSCIVGDSLRIRKLFSLPIFFIKIRVDVRYN